MKHKTSDLKGALLDAAVAKAEELEWSTAIEGADGACSVKRLGGGIGGPGRAWFLYRPSAEWQHGGEIIDRERIDLGGHLARWELGLPDGVHVARLVSVQIGDEKHVTFCTGPTPLIAAMRAYVASKLGEEIDL